MNRWPGLAEECYQDVLMTGVQATPDSFHEQAVWPPIARLTLKFADMAMPFQEIVRVWIMS